jgi:NADH-quinone oxidoreductase subunit H
MELQTKLLIAAGIKAVVVLLGMLTMLPLMTWFERKISAFAQDRIGPNRANFPWADKIPLVGPVIHFMQRAGLLHPFADALKMIAKEDFIPDRADRFLHTLAPWLAMVPALVTFAVIPFGPDIKIGDWVIPLQVANLNVGVLYMFAVASIGPYGAALAGWASNNKFSLIGGLRASAQMISYEVCMGVAIIGLVMVYGSLQLNDIVAGQDVVNAAGQSQLLWGFIPRWGVVTQPLGFILFFTAAYAETKRAPFDTPEGESEIVAGYHTEYSGLKFGMFYSGEFVEMLVLAGLITTLFFGGYLIPFVPASSSINGFLGLPPLFWTVVMVLAFLFKAFILMMLQFQIRWTLPRFRYDQIMRLGWKILIPVTIVWIAVEGVFAWFHVGPWQAMR